MVRETIVLTPKKVKAPSTIIEFLTGGKVKAEPLKALTSPQVTPILAGTAAGLATGNPLTAVKVGAAVGLGVGILETSPKAVKFIASKLKDPTKTGREIGKIIEEPSGIGKKIAAGLGIAAAGAAGAGLVTAAVKALEKRKEAKQQALVPSTQPSVVYSVLEGQKASTTPTATQPLSQPTKEKAAVETPKMPSINIKNQPKINIKVSTTGQKKKFINQYNVIRR